MWLTRNVDIYKFFKLLGFDIKTYHFSFSQTDPRYVFSLLHQFSTCFNRVYMLFLFDAIAKTKLGFNLICSFGEYYATRRIAG